MLTAVAMREAEASCGVPLDELMERAGAALAEAVWRFGGGAPVLVLCGPGNNGGDGYVAARVLRMRGLDVRIADSGPPQTELAQAAARAWGGAVDPLPRAKPAPVLVDALFGTGLTRALAPEIAEALHKLGAAARLIIAADLPSGVSTDDGADLGATNADVTLAFGAAKPAHLLQPGAALCGTVLIADIGMAAHSQAAVLTPPNLRHPGPSDHKYTRGMVVVVGGAMPGAAALSATAALRSGAGYVVGVGIDAVLPHAIVRRSHGELGEALADVRVGAVVIGPGLGIGDEAKALLALALASKRPLVVDGDALGLVPISKRAAPTILTPHAGEFARMFTGLTGSKIDRALAASAQSSATVIYKGADTVIVSPDGRVTLAPPTTTWLSTAGTGDVLAGIAGAMLARGIDPHDAACSAVWLHSASALRAGPGLIADDLAAHLAAFL